MTEISLNMKTHGGVRKVSRCSRGVSRRLTEKRLPKSERATAKSEAVDGTPIVGRAAGAAMHVAAMAKPVHSILARQLERTAPHHSLR